MGNKSPTVITYAVITSKAEPGETPIYRHPRIPKEGALNSSQNSSIANLQDAFVSSVARFGNRDFIERKCFSGQSSLEIINGNANNPNSPLLTNKSDTQKVTSNKTIDGIEKKQMTMSRASVNPPRNSQQGHSFMNYKETENVCRTLGSNISHMNLVTLNREYQGFELKFLVVYSENREEILLLEIVALLYGFTTVVIHELTAMKNLREILEQTTAVSIFLSSQMHKKILDNGNKDSLFIPFFQKMKNLILLDEIKEENKLEGVKYLRFYDLLNNSVSAGKKQIRMSRSRSDNIHTLVYTVGSNGSPVGAMLSHSNIISVITNFVENSGINENDLYYSTLSLANVYDRIMALTCMYVGASVGVINMGADTAKMKEELESKKPTVVLSVPRIYHEAYSIAQTMISELGGVKKSMTQRAVRIKLENLKKTGVKRHFFYDKFFLRRLRQKTFGDRVRLLVTASEVINEEIKNFFKILYSCPFIECYGQTETTGICFSTRLDDGAGENHVGFPYMNIEFKLVDVPEMEYSSRDKDDKGMAAPRGEICFKGPGVFMGYYKNPGKTNEVVDDEGWLHSGDIGQIYKNGALRIIDKKRNIFRLNNGDFVAAKRIETLYERCKVVSEIFIYGDSLQNYLVAIVVPDKDWILKLAKEKGLSDDIIALCNDKEVKEAVLREMENFARREKLSVYEIVRKIHLEETTFEDKELTTMTYKLKRYNARKTYEKQIEAMYKSGQPEPLQGFEINNQSYQKRPSAKKDDKKQSSDKKSGPQVGSKKNIV